VVTGDVKSSTQSTVEGLGSAELAFSTQNTVAEQGPSVTPEKLTQNGDKVVTPDSSDFSEHTILN
jgi:hypothetical protein